MILTGKQIAIIAAAEFTALGACLLFGSLMLHAQAPSAPTLYSIELNGQPVASNGPVNFVDGPGLQFSAPQIVNGVTTVTVSAVPSNLVAVSNCKTCTPGLKYVAGSGLPPRQGYTPYQPFVLTVDVPTQPGASLDVDSLGPVTIEGICRQTCWIVPNGSSVSSFAVH
jgi:hypothetical protein